MKEEKGVLIVAHKKSNGAKRYAILNRVKNWEGWELPKGHLENNDYRETVKIELEEELGISRDEIKEINDLDKEISWNYEKNSKKYKKIYQVFSAELEKDSVIDTTKNPCDEHQNGFFLNYEDAKSLLTHKNNKKLLKFFQDNF